MLYGCALELGSNNFISALKLLPPSRYSPILFQWLRYSCLINIWLSTVMLNYTLVSFHTRLKDNP